LTAFFDATTQHPEERERSRQVLRLGHLPVIQKPPQTDLKVRVIGGNTRQPDLGLLGPPLGSPPPRECVSIKQRVSLHGFVRMTPHSKSVRGVLSQSLQHAVPKAAIWLDLGVDQRLVDQLPEPIQRRAFGVNGFDGIKRPAATEDRQMLEQRSLVVVQQVVAPVDERSQRAVPGHRGAAAARQEIEALVQPLRDLLHRHGAQTRRCQLQCQRETVQPVADLGNRRSALLRQAESGCGRGGAIDEQSDRL
jgi:hypothetical protein